MTSAPPAWRRSTTSSSACRRSGRPSVARSVLQRLERLPGPAIGAGGRRRRPRRRDGDLELAAELAGLDARGRPPGASRSCARRASWPRTAPASPTAAVRDTVYARDPAARARAPPRAGRAPAGRRPRRRGRRRRAPAGHRARRRRRPRSGCCARCAPPSRAPRERGHAGEAARLLRRALDEPLEAGRTRRGRSSAELGRAEAVAGEPAAIGPPPRRPRRRPRAPTSASAWRSSSARALVLAGPAGRGGARACRTHWPRRREAARAPALALVRCRGRARRRRAPGTASPRRQASERLRAAARDLPRERTRAARAAAGLERARGGAGPARPAGGGHRRRWPGSPGPRGRLLRDEGPQSPAVFGLGLGARPDRARRRPPRASWAAGGRGRGDAAPGRPRAGARARRHADLHLRHGRLAEAEARARRGARGRPGAPARRGWRTLVRALVERGDLDAAEAALAAAGLAGTCPTTPLLDAVLFARGLLRAAQGLPEQAAADLELCGARQARLGRARTPACLPWRSHARGQLALGGEADRARAWPPRRSSWPAPSPRRARWASPCAEPAWSPAAPQADRAAARRRRDARRGAGPAGGGARAGRAGRRRAPRRAAGRRARATSSAGRSWPSAAGPGALVSRAREELAHRRGAAARRDRGAASRGSPPGERRAAELAAGGRSNREIAQRALPHAQDDRDAPVERLPQARHPLPRPARGGAGPGCCARRRSRRARRPRRPR